MQQQEQRAGLVQFGYVDLPPMSKVRSCIRPVLINIHPRIVDARARARWMSSWRSRSPRNETAISMVRAEMERLRMRAMQTA